MRQLFAVILLLAGPSASHAESSAWNFRVLLDGREIGRHEFTLRETGGVVQLQSDARFDVRFLFISAWSYVHQAVERWDGDCLQSLESRTETNGKRQTVSAARRDGGLNVEHRAGSEFHDGCVMSFAYWNPQILNARALLNGQNGELVPVLITALGPETVPVRGRPVAATRHRISGRGVLIDVWYAGERWIALEAQTDGERRLRYELI